ncbi:MAG: TIGR00730 family Rossman fold protein [Magnetovibrio sp.]|nr:TIGR00730 family Rossman fold protein [Magnetovibrio sp.]
MPKIRSLCVFCGSRQGSNPAYELAARKLGKLMGEKGINLIYGGGSIGIMGIIAEAVAASGGGVTGIMPKFLMDLEIGNTAVGSLKLTDNMHARKNLMYELSDGFISLPGGIGTLDETFEVISWKQLRLHDKPIVLLDCEDYWHEFESLVKKIILSEFAHDSVRALYTLVKDPNEVFPAIENPPQVSEEVLTSHI